MSVFFWHCRGHVGGQGRIMPLTSCKRALKVSSQEDGHADMMNESVYYLFVLPGNA